MKKTLLASIVSVRKNPKSPLMYSGIAYWGNHFSSGRYKKPAPVYSTWSADSTAPARAKVVGAWGNGTLHFSNWPTCFTKSSAFPRRCYTTTRSTSTTVTYFDLASFPPLTYMFWELQSFSARPQWPTTTARCAATCATSLHAIRRQRPKRWARGGTSLQDFLRSNPRWTRRLIH